MGSGSRAEMSVTWVFKQHHPRVQAPILLGQEVLKCALQGVTPQFGDIHEKAVHRDPIPIQLSDTPK